MLLSKWRVVCDTHALQSSSKALLQQIGERVCNSPDFLGAGVVRERKLPAAASAHFLLGPDAAGLYHNRVASRQSGKRVRTPTNGAGQRRDCGVWLFGGVSWEWGGGSLLGVGSVVLRAGAFLLRAHESGLGVGVFLPRERIFLRGVWGLLARGLIFPTGKWFSLQGVAFS